MSVRWWAVLGTLAVVACGGNGGSTDPGPADVPAADPGPDGTPEVPGDLPAGDPGPREDGVAPSDPGPGDPDAADPGSADPGPLDPGFGDPVPLDLPPLPDIPGTDVPPPSDVVAPPEVLLDEGPDVPPEYFDCKVLYACIEACGVDTNCRNRCLRRGVPDALADLEALEACFLTRCNLAGCESPACGTCPDPDACGACKEDAVLADCLSQAEACIPIGGDPCATVLDCVLECGDAACGYACVDRLSPLAKSLLDPVGECVNTACPGMDGPWGSPCILAAAQGTCKATVDACMAQTSLARARRP